MSLNTKRNPHSLYEGDFTKVLLSPTAFEFATKDAATLTAVNTKIKDPDPLKRVYPFGSFIAENPNAEPVKAAGDFIDKILYQKSPVYVFKQDDTDDDYTRKIFNEYNNRKFHAMFISSQSSLVGYTADSIKITSMEVSVSIRLENATATTPKFLCAEITIIDPRQITELQSTKKIEGLIRVEGLVDATLEIATPAPTATDVYFKVLQFVGTDGESSVGGLVAADFVLYDADGVTSNPITSVAYNSTTELYHLVAAGIENNSKLGLKPVPVSLDVEGVAYLTLTVGA